MSDLKFYPVFVNHIAETVQPQDLRFLFSRRGGRVIDVVVVSEHGFVNMADPEAAHDAILYLNGRCLHSYLLHVDYSEEFKQYLISNRIHFTTTRDPLTDTYPSPHPPYPAGEQFESPFYSEAPALTSDPDLLEERLRKVNQELRALNRSTMFSDRDRTRSRERGGGRAGLSPVREHRDQYRRSRSPHWRQDGPSDWPSDRASERSRPRSHSREGRPERGDGRSRTHRRHGHSARGDSAGEEVGEYELFVGGLHNKVSPDDLGSLFSDYGKVRKVETIKNFAFVRLLTRESRALAACQNLSGATCRQNRVSVSLRKGSRQEYLNEKLKAKAGGEREPEVEANILPQPVPVATAPVRTETDRTEETIGNFVRNSRQRNDILSSWQVTEASQNSELYFDGYNVSVGAKPFQDTTEEVEEVMEVERLPPAETGDEHSVSVSGPSCSDLRLIMQTIEKAAKSKLSDEAPPSSDLPSDPPTASEGAMAQRKLHISGLNSRIHDFDLKDVFSSYGQINRVDCKMSGRGQYAFILIFSSELSIVKCVCELDGRILKGAKIRVNFMRGSYEDSQEFKTKWSKEISVFMSPEHKKNNTGPLHQPPARVSLSRIGEGLKNIDMSLSLSLAPVLPDLPPPIDSTHGKRQQIISGHEESAADTDLEELEVEGTICSIQSKLILIEFRHPLTGGVEVSQVSPGQMYINGRLSLGYLLKSHSSTWPQIVQDFLQIGRQVVMEVRRLSEKEVFHQRVHWLAGCVWLPGLRPQSASGTLSLTDLGVKVTSAVIVRLLPSWGLLQSSQGNICFKVNDVFWDTDRLEEEEDLLERTDLEVGDVVAVQFRAGPEQSALLVWRISAEVDPWLHYRHPAVTSVRFLSSSSSLARQLPGDSEAQYFQVTAEVVQLQLPAGGLLSLSHRARARLGLPQSDQGQVYFHRSKLYLNGTKMRSDQRLEEEVVLGDEVCLDITTNLGLVHQPVEWVALAVRLHSAVRGVNIADRLRRSEPGLTEEKTVRARIVHLHPPPPSDPRAPATSGVAVLHSGEFMGQRVEFDRDVCSVFGYSLHRADLGQIVKFGEKVTVRLKAYNSYCVERVWLGEEEAGLASWLEDRNLSLAGLESQARLHLPLLGQQFSGQVEELLEDQTDARAGLTRLRIRSQAGTVVEAGRDRLFVFGHWMGRADLAYCRMSGESLI